MASNGVYSFSFSSPPFKFSYTFSSDSSSPLSSKFFLSCLLAFLASYFSTYVFVFLFFLFFFYSCVSALDSESFPQPSTPTPASLMSVPSPLTDSLTTAPPLPSAPSLPADTPLLNLPHLAAAPALPLPSCPNCSPCPNCSHLASSLDSTSPTSSSFPELHFLSNTSSSLDLDSSSSTSSPPSSLAESGFVPLSSSSPLLDPSPSSSTSSLLSPLQDSCSLPSSSPLSDSLSSSSTPPASTSFSTSLLSSSSSPSLNTSRQTLRYIVIDGSNVAMAHGNDKVFSCRGIRLAVEWFSKRGHTQIKTFVPKWRQDANPELNNMVEQEVLNQLKEEELLVFTPNCSYDDRHILEFAELTDGIVVSMDNYGDLANASTGWKKLTKERLLKFCFADDHFMPTHTPRGRYGPKLNKFLSAHPSQTKGVVPVSASACVVDGTIPKQSSPAVTGRPKDSNEKKNYPKRNSWKQRSQSSFKH